MPTARQAGQALLLAWYETNQRALPWRAARGDTPDPYRVWLSEIMLQQTTVSAVAPFYERFLNRFPDVHALANAQEDAVMAAWAGLGYYARARNLHHCARAVAASGGRFPRTVDQLQTLPGIGPYTARAIAAIAFGVPVVPVDGNVERIAARLFAIDEPLPAAKPAIAAAAARFGDHPAARARPADFAQALFDLGATICSQLPACPLCPLAQDCRAHANGLEAALPRKAPKKIRPVRYGAQFWLVDGKDQVLLRRRPPTGLLGSMTELPGTPWRADPWPPSEALLAAPMRASWQRAGVVRHVFTHFELLLDVYSATVSRIEAQGFCCPAIELDHQALPTVMRKCIRVAQNAAQAEPA